MMHDTLKAMTWLIGECELQVSSNFLSLKENSYNHKIKKLLNEPWRDFKILINH